MLHAARDAGVYRLVGVAKQMASALWKDEARPSGWRGHVRAARPNRRHRLTTGALARRARHRGRKGECRACLLRKNRSVRRQARIGRARAPRLAPPPRVAFPSKGQWAHAKKKRHLTLRWRTRAYARLFHKTRKLLPVCAAFFGRSSGVTGFCARRGRWTKRAGGGPKRHGHVAWHVVPRRRQTGACAIHCSTACPILCLRLPLPFTSRRA